MSDSSSDRWSAAAANWAESWGGATVRARAALMEAIGGVRGRRVLDVGCGSGDYLRMLTDSGAEAAGVDPAVGMREIAHRRNPDAVIRDGDFERIPWEDETFDAVVAVNALQFAQDMPAGLREAARVLRPGGRIGIANWAEARRNDVETVEAALFGGDEDDEDDEDYRCEGGLERVFRAAGLFVVASGRVPVDWRVPDDEALVRGVLLEDAAGADEERRAAVVRAARPFAVADGYLLRNEFRFAVAGVSAVSGVADGA